MALKVGVIGSSQHAQRHALGYKADSRVEVLGIAAHTNLDRARKVGEEVGAEMVTLNYRDLLDSPQIEAVSIVTPTYLHAKMAIEAAEAGKHVLCEKPMAITANDCDEMVAAAKKAGVLLAVGFNYRFQSPFQRMKDLLEKKEIGRMVQAFVLRLHPNPYPFEQPWRTKRSTMGGFILSMDCHDIDMLRWLMGDIKSIKAEMKRLVYNEIDYEDNGWLIFNFENGAIGALGSSMSCHMNIYEYVILGTTGTLKAHPYEKTVTLNNGKEERKESLREEIHSVHREVSLFIDSIERGKIVEPLASGEDGKTANYVVESAYKSMQTGLTIRL